MVVCVQSDNVRHIVGAEMKAVLHIAACMHSSFLAASPPRGGMHTTPTVLLEGDRASAN